MRRARLAGDGGEFLLDGGDDLPVDGVRKRVAVGFRCPPPKDVDTDRTHHDRCEHEAGNCQANANPHDWWSLQPHLSKKAESVQSKCLHLPLKMARGSAFCAEPLICRTSAGL